MPSHHILQVWFISLHLLTILHSDLHVLDTFFFFYTFFFNIISIHSLSFLNKTCVVPLVSGQRVNAYRPLLWSYESQLQVKTEKACPLNVKNDSCSIMGHLAASSRYLDSTSKLKWQSSGLRFSAETFSLTLTGKYKNSSVKLHIECQPWRVQVPGFCYRIPHTR